MNKTGNHEKTLCSVPAVYGRGNFSRMPHPDNVAMNEFTGAPDLPFVPDEIIRQVQRDSETRTIDIDGKPREIRTYGSTAIILMDDLEPMTISFEDGHCEVVFDEGKFVIPMRTNDDYKEFIIDDEVHRVKLGVPTQELFLDGKGYQCFFGGKPITVFLSGRPRTIRLVGNPPSVTIGKEINKDYLLGKISLVINANTKRMIPIYLDAKPQKLTIDGKIFILKFIHNFDKITLNTIAFAVHFGGLPTSISVRQCRKYLSFSHLPPDVIIGQTTVMGMDSKSVVPFYPDKPNIIVPEPPVPAPSHRSSTVGIKPPPLPPTLPLFPLPPRLTLPSNTVSQVEVAAPPPFPKLSAPMDIDARTDPSAAEKNVVPGSYITNEGAAQSPPPPRSVAPRVPTPAISPAPSSSKIDVTNLLQNLIKNGIIGKPKPTTVVIVDDDSEQVKAVVAPPKEKKIKPSIKIKKLAELRPAPQEPETLLDENDRDWFELEEGAEYKTSSVSKMDFLFKSMQLRK